jgi:hypothetical protein
VIALFVALGGTSFAAFKLPKNSVGTKQIKNGAVTLPKVSSTAVSVLKGAKGDPGPAGTPGTPGTSGAGVTPQLLEKTTGAPSVGTPKELAVECPTGHALGGGFVLFPNGGIGQEKLAAVRSYALPGDKKWLVRAVSTEPSLSWQLSVSVICG